MNRIFMASISALFLTAAVAPAALSDGHVGEMEEHHSSMSESSDSTYDVRRTEAFNLVSFAYRGELEEEGIPSYGQLIQGVRAGEVMAADIVEAAIQDGYLRPSAMGDEDYLDAVNLQLNSLTIGE